MNRSILHSLGKACAALQSPSQQIFRILRGAVRSILAQLLPSTVCTLALAEQDRESCVHWWCDGVLNQITQLTPELAWLRNNRAIHSEPLYATKILLNYRLAVHVKIQRWLTKSRKYNNIVCIHTNK